MNFLASFREQKKKFMIFKIPICSCAPLWYDQTAANATHSNQPHRRTSARWADIPTDRTVLGVRQ
jgi:hypothetical protein